MTSILYQFQLVTKDHDKPKGEWLDKHSGRGELGDALSIEQKSERELRNLLERNTEKEKKDTEIKMKHYGILSVFDLEHGMDGDWTRERLKAETRTHSPGLIQS